MAERLLRVWRPALRYGHLRCIEGGMSLYFRSEQWLPFPRTLVFAFFANPANLPPLMPSWQRARIEEATLVPPGTRPAGTPDYGGIAAGSGTRLLITARAIPGVPVRQPWLALIEDFQWNEGFCDVQVKGPFASWRHCHSVHDEVREHTPGTVVRDEVRYELPLWPVSRIGAPLGQLAMRAMFRYRQQRATELVTQFAASFLDAEHYWEGKPQRTQEEASRSR